MKNVPVLKQRNIDAFILENFNHPKLIFLQTHLIYV